MHKTKSWVSKVQQERLFLIYQTQLNELID